MSSDLPKKGIASLLFCAVILSFSTKAQPNGYYNNATGLSGQQLKTALYIIIRNHTVISYDGLWTAFQTTDDNPNSKVWDMYSNCIFTFGADQCGNYSNECDCYNREHSWPKSWFNDIAPMNSDLFHLIPTDGKVNGMRGNFPFGRVTNPTLTSGNGSKLGPCSYPGYTGTVFEPVDEYKGDFARNYFYMVTRYENLVSTWHSNDTNAEAVLLDNSFPAFETWFLNMLGEWHASDPVSQKEIDRNNEIYNNYQHNRNPFIDHPEYVQAIWGPGIPGQLTTTPAILAGFTYASGSGPSASQSYMLSGTSLSPANGSLTIAGTVCFEVSANNSSFDSSVSVSYTSSTLSNTTVYVRLKSGLAEGSYTNYLIVNSGGGASNVNVSCSGNVTIPVLPEPTNSPLDFSAHNIHLQWTDATGAIQPDGYLIRMSTNGFDDIAIPVDGQTYTGPSGFMVPFGVQDFWVKNLTPNTPYFFKLFVLTGSDVTINYKTDGVIPQLQQTTSP